MQAMLQRNQGAPGCPARRMCANYLEKTNSITGGNMSKAIDSLKEQVKTYEESVRQAQTDLDRYSKALEASKKKLNEYGEYRRDLLLAIDMLERPYKPKSDPDILSSQEASIPAGKTLDDRLSRTNHLSNLFRDIRDLTNRLRGCTFDDRNLIALIRHLIETSYSTMRKSDGLTEAQPATSFLNRSAIRADIMEKIEKQKAIYVKSCKDAEEASNKIQGLAHSIKDLGVGGTAGVEWSEAAQKIAEDAHEK
jgi:predicted RNase H-like nuclease (RuvC/YqgF family)